MNEARPGYEPEQPVLRPPWLRGEGDLAPELIDTRTRLVGRGLPPRDPSEPVFFPGSPAQPMNAEWMLLLADGERVSVEGPIVIGRKPFAVDGFPEAKLVTVVDRDKTVSKSHAILLPYDGGLFVLDLDSTNGVAVVANGRRTPATSTEFSPVPDGAVVELGSYLLGAERAE